MYFVYAVDVTLLVAGSKSASVPVALAIAEFEAVVDFAILSFPAH